VAVLLVLDVEVALGTPQGTEVFLYVRQVDVFARDQEADHARRVDNLAKALLLDAEVALLLRHPLLKTTVRLNLERTPVRYLPVVRTGALTPSNNGDFRDHYSHELDAAFERQACHEHDAASHVLHIHDRLRPE